MGRPIKKQFFANLISPYQDQATGGPTGQSAGAGLASVNVVSPGSGKTTLQGVTVGAPDMPGGVQAVATVTSLKAVSAVVAASGSGGTNQYYLPGETLVVSGGTKTASAAFNVASVSVRTAGVDISVNSGTNYLDGDTLTFSGAGWTTAFTATAITNGLGNLTGLGYTPGTGVYTGSTAYQTTGTFTTNGTGTGALLSLGFGVKTITLSNGGSYTAIPANDAGTANTTNGTGATLTVSYGVNTVGVVTAGSGYSTAPSVTLAGTTLSAVLAASSTAGVLKVTAFLKAEDGGVSALISDIMKQESSRRYLVRNAQGKSQCKLVAKADGSLLAGEMNLIATDAGGKQYYVTKLTSRRALLTRVDGSGGYEFATDSSAGWTVGAASAGVVSIATA